MPVKVDDDSMPIQLSEIPHSSVEHALSDHALLEPLWQSPLALNARKYDSYTLSKVFQCQSAFFILEMHSCARHRVLVATSVRRASAVPSAMNARHSRKMDRIHCLPANQL